MTRKRVLLTQWSPRHPAAGEDLDALSDKELLYEIWKCLYSIRQMLVFFVVLTFIGIAAGIALNITWT